MCIQCFEPFRLANIIFIHLYSVPTSWRTLPLHHRHQPVNSYVIKCINLLKSELNLDCNATVFHTVKYLLNNYIALYGPMIGEKRI